MQGQGGLGAVVASRLAPTVDLGKGDNRRVPNEFEATNKVSATFEYLNI